MDTNENKEEVLEDISEKENNETIEDEIKPDKKIDEEIVIDEGATVKEETSKEDLKTEAEDKTVILSTDELNQDENSDSNEEKNYETVQESIEEKPKKNKAPIIILLVILLIIDVALLVLYIIGFDKVLSFIK